jgi:preprotein translocase subunit YajC
VYLRGRVVEHERGWRAEFAYPKSLVLLPAAIPFSLSATDARLKTLTAFGTDIFIQHDHERTPLWTNRSGHDTAGLDYLIRARREYYVRRQAERALKEGDRVTILGRGIGVVKEASPEEVMVVLGKMAPLRIARKQIIRDEQNNRWELNPMSAEGSEYANSNLRPSQHQRSEL